MGDCGQQRTFVEKSGCNVQDVVMTTIASLQPTEQSPKRLYCRQSKSIRISLVDLHFHVADQGRIKVFGYINRQLQRANRPELLRISTQDNGSILSGQTSQRDPNLTIASLTRFIKEDMSKNMYKMRRML